MPLLKLKWEENTGLYLFLLDATIGRRNGDFDWITGRLLLLIHVDRSCIETIPVKPDAITI